MMTPGRRARSSLGRVDDVICLGTFSRLTAVSVKSLSLAGYGEIAARQVSTLGNDAVIVSRHLAKCGLRVRTILLNPTSQDVRILEESSPKNMIIEPSSAVEGPVTDSICLQASDGSRYWILSRKPSPVATALTGKANVIYLDLYDEVEEFVVRDLGRYRATGAKSIIAANLSTSRHVQKAKQLAQYTPYYIQASLGDPQSTTGTALLKAAAEIREAAQASYVAVTAGPSGAALVGLNYGHYVAPSARVSCMGIGAGAAFSASMIEAMLRRQDARTWLEFAVVGAQSFLRLSSSAT